MPDLMILFLVILSCCTCTGAADLKRRALNSEDSRKGSNEGDSDNLLAPPNPDEMTINTALNVTKVMVGRRVETLVEGDIISPGQSEQVESDEPLLRKAYKTSLWPNGEVPFRFGKGITEKAKEAILRAMAHWASQTCITFRWRTDEKNYVEFVRQSGCYSSIGMVEDGRKQIISVGDSCLYMGIVAHEIGHAIGFIHEQSRPDRDEYVEIRLENVNQYMAYNLKKLRQNAVDLHNITYDYGSIMHYGPKAFSINDKDTIVPIVKVGEERPVIGQREQLSESDVAMARAMYQCDDPDRKPTECADQYSPSMCVMGAIRGRCFTDNKFWAAIMMKGCRASCGLCGDGANF